MLKFLLLMCCIINSTIFTMDQSSTIDGFEQALTEIDIEKLLTEADIDEILKYVREHLPQISFNNLSISSLEKIIKIQQECFRKNIIVTAVTLFKIIGIDAISALKNIIGDKVVFVIQHGINSSEILIKLEELNLSESFCSYSEDSPMVVSLKSLKSMDQDVCIFKELGYRETIMLIALISDWEAISSKIYDLQLAKYYRPSSILSSGAVNPYYTNQAPPLPNEIMEMNRRAKILYDRFFTPKK